MSKFAKDDHVRVIGPHLPEFDSTGKVLSYIGLGMYAVRMVNNKAMAFHVDELILADPDVHTVLDQMDAESAPVDHAATLKTMAQGLAAEMDAAQRAHREAVTNPPHYVEHPSGIEQIQITRHESFLRGNIIKYVMRAPYKGRELEDLRKAAQYLQWEIERAGAAQ